MQKNPKKLQERTFGKKPNIKFNPKTIFPNYEPFGHAYIFKVINAAPDSNVNLHEAKPLTLNMEFEMTRPMLDFLIRLHKNGDKPYDEVCKLFYDATSLRNVYYQIKYNKF